MCGYSIFIFPINWYGVSEIELSHMGKNSGKSDLVFWNDFPYLIWDKEKKRATNNDQGQRLSDQELHCFSIHAYN